MSSINTQIIEKQVTSGTRNLDIANVIRYGDYGMQLIVHWTDITSILGTCSLYFTLLDGTTATREAADGVAIDNSGTYPKVTYTFDADDIALFSQKGLVLWFRFANSNLITPLKLTFRNIEIVPGGTPVTPAVPYPEWAVDVRTELATIGEGNTGTDGQVWTSDGAGSAGWQSVAGAGLGDVTGPTGATAGNLAALDETGKVLSDSGSKPADFATAVHTHDYAATNHNHDSAYSAVGHTHDYAASNHNHDAAYSATNHTHASLHSHDNAVALAAVLGTNTGDQDLSDYVQGPASATSGNLPTLDATGKVLSDSGIASADLLTATDASVADAIPSTLSPAIVITFDDSSDTIYDYAWPVLKSEGVPATFFVNPHRIGTGLQYWSGWSSSWAEIEEMYNDTSTGRVEIQNHTDNHTDVSTANSTKLAIIADIEDSITTFRTHGIVTPHLAYPGGLFDEQGKMIASHYFQTARYTGGEYNTRNVYDPYAVRSTLMDAKSAATLNAVIDRAKANNYISIFYGHAISPAGVIGTNNAPMLTPDQFTAMIQYAKAQGVRIITYSKAIQELQASSPVASNP